MASKNEELRKQLAGLVKFLKDETKQTDWPIKQGDISKVIGLSAGTLGKIISGDNPAKDETLKKHIDNIRAHFKDYLEQRKYSDSKLDQELKLIHANLTVIKSKIAILWERLPDSGDAARNIEEIEGEVDGIVSLDKD